MAGYSRTAANTPANTAVRAYANVGLESAVASAHPHRLILMLFEGAILAIAHARNAMPLKDVPSITAKGKAISKAIQIVDEGLKASLIDNGTELAANLRALYEYMSHRLLLASLKNDSGVLDEVTRLLNELKDAWHAIEPSQR